jgi:hypothetical protein
MVPLYPKMVTNPGHPNLLCNLLLRANTLANNEEQGAVEEGEHEGQSVGRRVNAHREVGPAVEAEHQALGLQSVKKQ